MPTIQAHTLSMWISEFRAMSNVISDFVTKFPMSDGTHACFFMDESVLGKYDVELSSFIVSTDLTPREQQFYAYNPRLFAYDLYGAPEFWYLVLHANEMLSATEFTPVRVKFYQTSVINTLNTIRQIEMERHDANEQEMTNVVVNNQVVNADVMASII